MLALEYSCHIFSLTSATIVEKHPVLDFHKKPITLIELLHYASIEERDVFALQISCLCMNRVITN